MKFTERFNELMKENEYDVENFSKLINVSEYRIKRWIEGKSYPKMKEIVLMSLIFKCSCDYIVGRNSERQIIKHN